MRKHKRTLAKLLALIMVVLSVMGNRATVTTSFAVEDTGVQTTQEAAPEGDDMKTSGQGSKEPENKGLNSENTGDSKTQESEKQEVEEQEGEKQEGKKQEGKKQEGEKQEADSNKAVEMEKDTQTDSQQESPAKKEGEGDSLGKLTLRTEGVNETATYDGNAHYGHLENLKVTDENGNQVEGAKILYKKGNDWVETKHHLYVAGTNKVTVKAVKDGYDESDPASFTITVEKRVITVKVNKTITYGEALPSFDDYTLHMGDHTFTSGEALPGISGNQKFTKLTLGIKEAQGDAPLDAGTYDIAVLDKEILRDPNGPYPTTQSFDIRVEGKLTVNPVQLKISAEGANADYARKPLYGTVKVTDGKDNPVTEGFKIRYTSSKAGSSYATEGELTWEEWTNKTRIKQEGGYDITQPYRFAAGTSTVTVQAVPLNGNYKASEEATYTLTVGRTDGITIEAQGGTYVYDGQPHGAKSLSFGSTHNHTPDIQYSTDGGKTWVTEEPKLTNAGTMTVTVKASFKNYNPAEAIYTVTVKKKTLGIKASNLTSRYQGKEIKQPSYFVYNWTAAAGDKVVNVTNTTQDAEGNTVKAVDVGTYKNVPSGARVENAAGEDVTGNYDIKYYNGEIKIEPRRMRLEVRDAQKLFGEPDPAYSIIEHGPDGKVPGQKFFTDQEKYVRKSTDGYHERAVGEYTVTIDHPEEGVVFDAEGNDVTKNYEITVTPGTMTIKENKKLIPVKVRYSSNSYPYTGKVLTGDQMFEHVVGDGEPADGLTFEHEGKTYTISSFLRFISSDGLAKGPGSVIDPGAQWGMDVEDAIGRFASGAEGIFDEEGNDVNGTIFYWDGWIHEATNKTGPSIAPVPKNQRASVTVRGRDVTKTYTGEEITVGADELFETVVTHPNGSVETFPGLSFTYDGIKLKIEGGPSGITASGTEIGSYASGGSITFPIQILDERNRDQNGQLFSFTPEFNGGSLIIVEDTEKAVKGAKRALNATAGVKVTVRHTSKTFPYTGQEITLGKEDLFETEVDGQVFPGISFKYEGKDYTVAGLEVIADMSLTDAGNIISTPETNWGGTGLAALWPRATWITDEDGNNVNGTLFSWDGWIRAAENGVGPQIVPSQLHISPGKDGSGGENYYSKYWDGKPLYPENFYVYYLDANNDEVRVTDGIEITYKVAAPFIGGKSYVESGTLTWEQWAQGRGYRPKDMNDPKQRPITQPYRTAPGKPVITVTAKPVQGNNNYTASDPATYTLHVKPAGKLVVDATGASETVPYDGNYHYGNTGALQVTANKDTGESIDISGVNVTYLYSSSKGGVYETEDERKVNGGNGTRLMVAGTKTVWVKATAPGYEDSEPVPFTITVEKRVITIDVGNHEITYGDSLPSFDNYTITMDNGQEFKVNEYLPGISGNQMFETLTLGIEEAQNGATLNVGTYDIKALKKVIQRQPNGPYPTTQSFDIQVTGQLTVKKAQLQIEAEQNYDYIYDHTAHHGDVKVKDGNGKQITTGFKIKYENLDSPGSYAYAGTGELTWDQWDAKTTPKTVNGVKQEVQPYRTIAGTARVRVTIVPDDPDNYAGSTKEYTITVKPYPLTVTLGDATMTYGDPGTFAADPYTVSAMPRGGSSSFRINATQLSYDTASAAGLAAGTYPDRVTLSTGVAIEYNSAASGWVDVTRNFAITVDPGTLTVTAPSTTPTTGGGGTTPAATTPAAATGTPTVTGTGFNLMSDTAGVLGVTRTTDGTETDQQAVLGARRGAGTGDTNNGALWLMVFLTSVLLISERYRKLIEIKQK